MEPMDNIERGRLVLKIEMEGLRRLVDRLDQSFSDAVQALLETVNAGKKIVVLGVGKSGQIGEKIAATLTSTGSPAVTLDALNALHGDLGILSDGDLVLAFSYSGETTEVLNVLPALKRFDVRLISFTGDLQSTLAKHSEVVLPLKSGAHHEHHSDACPG